MSIRPLGTNIESAICKVVTIFSCLNVIANEEHDWESRDLITVTS